MLSTQGEVYTRSVHNNKKTVKENFNNKIPGGNGEAKGEGEVPK